jgi:hypothetical protein
MDRLAETVAAHLCRHRASACSDSPSTLRGVYAEVGAVEVVRDAAAKRRYMPRERGLAQARRRPSTEPAQLTIRPREAQL